MLALVVIAVLAGIAYPAGRGLTRSSQDIGAQTTLLSATRAAVAVTRIDSRDAFSLDDFTLALGGLGGATPGVHAASGWEFADVSERYGQVSLGLNEDGSEAALVMRSHSGACSMVHAYADGYILAWTTRAGACSAAHALLGGGGVDADGVVLAPAPGPVVPAPPVELPADPAPSDPEVGGDEGSPEPAGPGPYQFEGFFEPVSNTPIVNLSQASQAVPMKWSLNGYHGMDIFADGAPFSEQIHCESHAPSGELELAETPGESGLSYSSGNDRYQWVWKTSGSWRGQCRRLVFEFDDGTTRWAYFQFRANGQGNGNGNGQGNGNN